jgi:hypothetical protein
LRLCDLRQPPRQLDEFCRRLVRGRPRRRELVLVLFPIGLPCNRVLLLVSLPPCPFGRELLLV